MNKLARTALRQSKHLKTLQRLQMTNQTSVEIPQNFSVN